MSRSAFPLARFDVYAPGDAMTEADHATISHLIRTGLGENTMRALRSDIDYLEAWTLAATGAHLPWPPDRATLLRFIAHHLWDPARRAEDPDHGMPPEIETVLRASGHLRVRGPHAPSTVRRRLSSWRTMGKWREIDGAVFSDPVVLRTLSAAIRAADRPRHRKSARPITIDMLGRILKALEPWCTPRPLGDRDLNRVRLAALRDRALLAIAFASGGRRRSEMASLMMSQLDPLAPIEDPQTGTYRPSLSIRMGRTKTSDTEDDLRVYVSGPPVVFLERWLAASGITGGAVFRRIDRWGALSEHGLADAAVNGILKARLKEIGEDPALFSAHGLRSGFVTEALGQGLRMEEVMGQTLHRSIKSVHGYFQDIEKRSGRAARLLD
ncbi:integrase [Palleronia abyssalis]|uniref:Tyrosine recombinase XerC n=1 Tax=Palleronia abyssalis TaxID=1501240 RepID=A0A2R8BZC1_9RHOB|nr:integrase [Palleronia abyssalis]SPJ25480.1 Tyrosine recombinase XerC [Palleronia abyssalis]